MANNNRKLSNLKSRSGNIRMHQYQVKNMENDRERRHRDQVQYNTDNSYKDLSLLSRSLDFSSLLRSSASDHNEKIEKATENINIDLKKDKYKDKDANEDKDRDRDEDEDEDRRRSERKERGTEEEEEEKENVKGQSEKKMNTSTALALQIEKDGYPQIIERERIEREETHTRSQWSEEFQTKKKREINEEKEKEVDAETDRQTGRETEREAIEDTKKNEKEKEIEREKEREEGTERWIENERRKGAERGIEIEVTKEKEKETEKEKEKESEEICRQMYQEHHVQPGASWGTLPPHRQRQWLSLDCDSLYCEYNKRKGRGKYTCLPLATEI